MQGERAAIPMEADVESPLFPLPLGIVGYP